MADPTTSPSNTEQLSSSATKHDIKPAPRPETKLVPPASNRDLKKAKFMRRLKIDSALFILLVLVALVGVAMTNSSKNQAYVYWWVVMGIQAVVTTIWAVWLAKEDELNKTVPMILYEQAVLWGSGFVAVFFVYKMMGFNQIDFNATGLLMLLILALVTFIDGALVSWKLYIVSLIFIVTLFFASYVEKFLWVMVIVALAAAVIAIGVSFWRVHHKKHEAEQAQLTAQKASSAA
jgi:hypothetical protein